MPNSIKIYISYLAYYVQLVKATILREKPHERKNGDKKMLEKIYFAVWGLGLLAAGTVYLTGNMTPTIATVFGFLTFGMIFMGMIGVLPFYVTHEAHPKH